MENRPNDNITENANATNKAKKSKMFKLIGGIGGFVILIVIIILAFRPAKYVSCITFLGNDITAYYDNDGNLKLPSDDEVKRPGYRFMGWYTTKKFVTEYDADTFTGKKLYAKYERLVYNIVYEDCNQTDDQITATNGVLIWQPSSFFLKYNDRIISDEDATNAWGLLIGSETDRVNVIYILNPESSTGEVFVRWEVYLESDEEMTNVITTISPDGNKNYSTFQKDFILEYEGATGIILKAIWR